MVVQIGQAFEEIANAATGQRRRHNPTYVLTASASLNLPRSHIRSKLHCQLRIIGRVRTPRRHLRSRTTCSASSLLPTDQRTPVGPTRTLEVFVEADHVRMLNPIERRDLGLDILLVSDDRFSARNQPRSLRAHDTLLDDFDSDIDGRALSLPRCALDGCVGALAELFAKRVLLLLGCCDQRRLDRPATRSLGESQPGSPKRCSSAAHQRELAPDSASPSRQTHSSPADG